MLRYLSIVIAVLATVTTARAARSSSRLLIVPPGAQAETVTRAEDPAAVADRSVAWGCRPRRR